jgi:hypothetical protein
MGKYNKGTVRRYSKRAYGVVRNNILDSAVSRIGRESKYGKRKGRATPGDHSNSLKVR